MHAARRHRCRPGFVAVAGGFGFCFLTGGHLAVVVTWYIHTAGPIQIFRSADTAQRRRDARWGVGGATAHVGAYHIRYRVP